LLPFRLLFSLLFLPLLILKVVIGGLLMIVLAPILIIAAVVGLLALVAAVAVPLLPLLAIGLIVWLLVRATRPALAG
jgi:hypothetical protein